MSICSWLLDRTAHIGISEEHHGPPDARRYNYMPTYILRGLTRLHLELSEEERRAEEVPFGLQISSNAQSLEENPTEQEILRLMMELTVQDGPYWAIAEELNRRGYRTRQGMRWTAVSVFQMLPRLIEVGPKIFATREWQERREHFGPPN